ncbi:hypothetical protein HanRHA438_Chr03g0147051 [Helianthus annuus]|nr:hypothetical protein HanRHA438_Chr03g0147051 [Helianthus annuus]
MPCLLHLRDRLGYRVSFFLHTHTNHTSKHSKHTSYVFLSFSPSSQHSNTTTIPTAHTRTITTIPTSHPPHNHINTHLRRSSPSTPQQEPPLPNRHSSTPDLDLRPKQGYNG